MATPDGALSGDAMLEAVTAAMVRLHHRYYHREPATARTMLLGEDLLVCVLSGVYTDVEKTMIEIQRGLIVEAVEALSGRHVLAFISNHHVGPDIEIELFFLADPVADGAGSED
jgi:uncharacterized protein YbcI